MIDIASGHPAIDHYLAQNYERVLGMSSRFRRGDLRTPDPPADGIGHQG